MKKYQFSEKNDLSVRYDLSLIIPTLNRPKTVYANVASLISNFNKIKPKITIQVFISENDSDSDQKIDKNKLSSILDKNDNKIIILFVFIQRSKRLSLGEHMSVLSRSVNCSWMLWLGDDDLLTPTYLNYLTDVIELDDAMTQSVFTDFSAITEKEFFRLAKSNEKIQNNVSIKCHNYNSDNLINIINRGHQLSGLLYRKEIMDASYQILPEDNLYPWICHQVKAIKRGNILSVDGIHVRVTSNTNKLFSYRKDGLLPELSEAVLCGFSPDRKLGVYYSSKLITDISYWRIFKTAKTGLGALWNYILSFNNRKTDRKVFFMSLPKVAIKCLYRHLVYSLPTLHIQLRNLKRFLFK